MDVEASRAIRQAEVGAEQTMIERTERRFDIKPAWLAGDTAYGSGKNLDWLVKGQIFKFFGCQQIINRLLNRGQLLLHNLLIVFPNCRLLDSIRTVDNLTNDADHRVFFQGCLSLHTMPEIINRAV